MDNTQIDLLTKANVASAESKKIVNNALEILSNDIKGDDLVSSFVNDQFKSLRNKLFLKYCMIDYEVSMPDIHVSKRLRGF